MNAGGDVADDLGVWYAPWFWSIPQGDNALVVFTDGRSYHVSAKVIHVLTILRSPRTLPGQLTAIQNALTPVLPREQLSSMLSKLQSADMLRPLLVEHGSHPSGHPRSTLNTVVIITRDRPSQLRRCIQSLASVQLTAYRKLRVVVIDSSRSSKNRKANRESLGVIESSGRLYFGREETEELIAYLVRQGVSPDQTSFGILSRPNDFSAGCARNLAILLAGDEDILMADDDTEFVFYETEEEFKNTLRVSSLHRSRSLQFFAHRTDWKRHPASGDPFRHIEELLGQTSQSAYQTWKAGPKAVDLLASAHDPHDYLNQPVRVVQFGICGDSGRHTGDWLGLMGESTLKRLLCSVETQLLARSSREVCDIPSSFEVFKDPFLIGSMFALRTKGETPPFPPLYRNEDGVFASALELVSGGMCFGAVPLGAYHNPRGHRTYASGDTLRPSDFLLALLSEVRSVTEGAPLSVINLSKAMELLHSRSPDFLIRLARTAYLVRLSNVALLREATHGLPKGKELIHLQGLETSLLLHLRSLGTMKRIEIQPSGLPEVQVAGFIEAYITFCKEWPSMRVLASGFRKLKGI